MNNDNSNLTVNSAAPAPDLDPRPVPPVTPTPDSKVSRSGEPPETCNLHPATGNFPPFTPAPGESARAFAAFCAYLELGPRRRYATVARQVGASLRTIKNWALRFDWRGRVSTCAARTAEQFILLQEEEVRATAVREKSFRERQLALAEHILDVTERYFERMEDVDLDQLRFPDACRALEFASRLLGQSRESEAAAAAPDHGLRDQLAALLDQAFRETQKPAAP